MEIGRKMTPTRNLETCRLCGTDSQSLLNVFDKNSAAINEKIENLFGIKISVDDACQNICIFCNAKLVLFYDFHQMVKAKQMTFKTSTEVVAVTVKTELDSEPTNLLMEVSMSESAEVDCNNSKEPKWTDLEPDLLLEEHEESENEEIKSETLLLDERDSQIREFFNLTCAGCTKKFLSWYELRRHSIKDCNIPRPSIMCTKSNACSHLRLQSLTDLESHIVYHTDPGKLSCKVCGRISFSEKNLRQHQFTHVQKQRGIKRSDHATPRYCPYCNREFKSKTSYDYHVQYVHMSKEDKLKREIFQCDQCEKVFHTKGGLDFHIRKKHASDAHSEVVCDICAKTFPNKYDFRQHYAIHTAARVNCPKCGKDLASKHRLYKHMQMKHPEGAPLKCDHCDKELKSKVQLSRHMRTVHVERSFACGSCDKTFKTKTQLNEHEVRHNPNGPVFGCDVCPYANFDLRNMKKHRVTKHPEAPPLKAGHIADTFRLEKR